METSPFDAVYVRTDAGHSHVVRREGGLPPDAQRLLLIVNGVTPFGHLAERLLVDDPLRPRDSLLALGLIAPVRLSKIYPYMTVAC